MSVPANFFDTYNVVASPTNANEIVVAILTNVSPLLPGLAVNLSAEVQITPEAGCATVVLTIRQNSLTGNIVGEPWTFQGPATNDGDAKQGVAAAVDFPGDFADATYVLTVTCTSAAGASVVTALHFGARVC